MERICLDADKQKANYGVRAKLELLKFNPDAPPAEQFPLVESLRNALNPEAPSDKLDITPEYGQEGLINPCVDYVDDTPEHTPLPYEGKFYLSMTDPVLIGDEDDDGKTVATLRVTTWL